MTTIQQSEIPVGTACIFHETCDGELVAYLCTVTAPNKPLKDCATHYSISRFDGHAEFDVHRCFLHPTNAESLKALAHDFLHVLGADSNVRKKIHGSDARSYPQFVLDRPNPIVFRQIQHRTACWAVESDGVTLATTTESDFDSAIGELMSILNDV